MLEVMRTSQWTTGGVVVAATALLVAVIAFTVQLRQRAAAREALRARLDSYSDILRQLPSAERFDIDEDYPVPMRRAETFHVPYIAVIRRLFQWIPPIAIFVASLAWLGITTRAMKPREVGARFRKSLERLGGTFVKVGQQLSTRHDLLPSEICFELAQLLDRMPAFPTEEAVKEIEAAAGKPLDEVFSSFDPDPIGAGSVACVYHAVLKSGEEVAVKVRRPNIGKVFAADMAALKLIAFFLEFTTILRPGSTKQARIAIKEMLFEELDFRMEARYQQLFKRNAKKAKQKWIRVPRIYRELSGSSVIVNEFVRGVWLSDLVAIRESGNEEMMALVRAQGINPKKVAKRLLRVRDWSIYENLFYHADPHPANVLVQPGNKLMFIDFGACGPTTARTRRNMSELLRRASTSDAQGMVQVFHTMLSPISRVDMPQFTLNAEPGVFKWMYGMEAKDAEWFEHTSVALWIELFKHARDLNISINRDVIRLMRSSLMYDTIAARLYPDIDIRKEYWKYIQEARCRTAKHVVERLKIRFGGVGWLLEIGDKLDLVERLLYRIQKTADEPVVSFLAMTSKASLLINQGLRLVMFGIAAFSALALWSWLDSSDTATPLEVALQTLSNPLLWGLIGLFGLRAYRTSRFRLDDIDDQGTQN